MNDGQLIHRLRRLDAPATPDQAFADSLFGTLRAEVARPPHGLRATRAVVAFAASAAAILVAAVLVLGLLVNAPGEPGGSPFVPPPSPSPSSLPSPDATPGQSASARATPTAAATTSTTSSPSTGWRRGAPMPAAYANAAFAGVVDDKVWMVHRQGFRDRPAEVSVLVYDVAADEWRNRGQITYDASNADFSGSAAVDREGTLYVFGHAEQGGARVAVGFDASVNLDATNAGPTPIGFGFGFQGTPVIGPDGRFYLLEVMFGAEYQGPSRLVSYDPATDLWAEPPAIPTPRVAPVLAVDRDGGVLVVGGRTPEREIAPDTTQTDPIAAVERFDTETGEWSTGVPLRESIEVTAESNGVAVVTPDGALIVYGGFSYPGPMRLEQGATEWRDDAFAPSGLLASTAVFLSDGTLVVFGLVNDGTGSFAEPETWILQDEALGEP